ncbi:phage late control D family protein [Chromobacterium violaceum]|uniref:Phage protein D n=1 Tax=Chromobacterium violaceum TaxID=536 RepID=A0AAX2MD30_CHRVL|nr:contractile injection system protein, VgrG/Pvc8 family [Chromobacterium violaceum]OLZ75290.1 Cro/Cl family transcriptional regulator [Chromobacterium violaceum]STB70143.1 Phage protein D [Chromobacterium violaceum]SUX34787.1 Phage protein D [Chromobacterium violaceum]
MDALNTVPHPVFQLSYGQHNITSDITPYVLSVTYTDYLSGQSDELEVELEDADGRWIHGWYPRQGDALTLKIGYAGEPLLPCGAFEIDEVEFAFPPSTVSIRALAAGVKKSVRTRVGRAYENTTLAAIAQRIAKRNHLTLVGKIRDIRIDRVTQYQERDVAFLTRLAREYGYVFKITGSKMVFSELADLRDGQPVLSLQKTDLISIRLRDKIKEVYPQAKGKYHDPKTKKLVVYDLKNGQVEAAGHSTAPGKAQQPAASGDTLKLSRRSPSKATAQAKAQAALDRSNLQQTAGSLTLPGRPKLVAGVTFDLAGLGRLTGRYLVESARHRIDRGGGYLTELEVKRASLPVQKGGKPSHNKPAGKGLKVYGLKDGQVDVVGTTPQKGKK